MIAEQVDQLENAKRAVVTVGEGRGFVIDTDPRLVVTAAHCLPQLPPAHSAMNLEEKTYKDLLAPLGNRKRMVWAECLFVDPVADIAVLGTPDGQALHKEADAYDDLMERTRPIGVADAPIRGRGWLLRLDGDWGNCVVEHVEANVIWITNATKGIIGGMSGSPIVNDDGSAIGVLNCGGGSLDALQTEGGPEARLTHCLPGWVLLAMASSA